MMVTGHLSVTICGGRKSCEDFGGTPLCKATIRRKRRVISRKEHIHTQVATIAMKKRKEYLR
jgi:hypothetical protein